MKTIALLVGLLIITQSLLSAEGQNDTTTIKATSASKLTSPPDTLNNDSILTMVGTLRFYDQHDNIKSLKSWHSSPEPSPNNTQIEKIFLRWKDGFILEVLALDKAGHQYHNKKPIALTTNVMSYDNPLYCNIRQADGTSINSIIYLNEFIRLDRENDFVPNDGSHWFSSQSTSYVLRRSEDLNSQLHVKLFSDALAALSDAPNGLAQTEISYSQVTGKRTLGRMPVILAKRLNIDMSMAKYDSKFQFADVSQTSLRTDIWQRSYFQMQVKETLLESWLAQGSESYFHLDGGAGFMLTKGAIHRDTTYIDSTNISTPYLTSTAGLHFQAGKAWSADIDLNIMWQRIPQLKDYKPNDPNFNNWYAAFKPQLTLAYTPNEATQLFARASLNTMQHEGPHHFVQFQVGYSVAFTDWINEKINK